MDTDTAQPVRTAWHSLLREERDAIGDKPTADDTLFRASDSRMCLRKRGMKALGLPSDFDVEDNSLRAFNRGNAIHDDMQRVIVERWGGQIEVVTSYKDGGVSVSGSADGVYQAEDAEEIPIETGTVLAEVKSMKEFGWNLAVHGAGNPRWKQVGPTGPKLEHVTQAAIYAMSKQIDAAYLHMIYVNKNTDDIVEWLIHVDEWVDVLTGDVIDSLEGCTPRSLALEELDMLRELQQQVGANVIPAAVMPGYGTVDVPPEHGASKGNPWLCRYCEFNTTCRALGPDAFPIDNTETEAA